MSGVDQVRKWRVANHEHAIARETAYREANRAERNAAANRSKAKRKLEDPKAYKQAKADEAERGKWRKAQRLRPVLVRMLPLLLVRMPLARQGGAR